MLNYEELRALLCLNRTASGLAARQALALFQEGLLPREVCERLMAAGALSEEKLFPDETLFHPGREIESAGLAGIRLLTWFDADYSQSLRSIENAPLVLYVRGTLTPQDAAAVAVVGSRHPSFYGSSQAERLARELAESGLTVVSGLARGIDEAAHKGCLTVGHGRTLAVLGCGVDRIYPRENEKLYAAIAERGALISEFPLGTGPLAWHFPRRNRIIAGLSMGVLVVEAHLRSGSLITAQLAAEQGRQVFAVPGPVDQWTSRGANQLLREGAVLVESAQDILEDLAPLFKTGMAQTSAVTLQKQFDFSTETAEPESSTPQSGTADLDDVLLKLLQEEPLTADEILVRRTQESREVLAVLGRLEISGRIAKARDGRFAVCV